MPLKKKQRNVLWYSYVAAMVVFYELAMLMLGSTVPGFLVAFGGIAVITFSFVVLMRRLSRPGSGQVQPPNQSASTVGARAEQTDA